ncbi:hypothetical protein EJB05_12882 [Eragrostis curvula]|uniref:Uncharacterized protein n=1 Tax=Eragrostis curvula TaxID=38414 RepID=A0A5J9VSQ2_9POAL|nr:hypothetical protein EJB05_12882 [Eragrostis curvula]
MRCCSAQAPMATACASPCRSAPTPGEHKNRNCDDGPSILVNRNILCITIRIFNVPDGKVCEKLEFVTTNLFIQLAWIVMMGYVEQRYTYMHIV